MALRLIFIVINFVFLGTGSRGSRHNVMVVARSHAWETSETASVRALVVPESAGKSDYSLLTI